jgi:hypothetical protein
MKWEIYKQMNDSQRMYWHYYFEKKVHIIRPSIYGIILLYTSLSMLLFSAYFFYMQSKYDTIWLLLGQASKISIFMLMLWVSDYIASWFVYFVYVWKENKWLKSEGLK